jgi:DNA-directed RNA polymerases I, II, and III subunit RPABC2
MSKLQKSKIQLRADEDDELPDPDFPEDSEDEEDDEEEHAVRPSKKKRAEKSRPADSDEDTESESENESAAESQDDSDEDSEADPEEDAEDGEKKPGDRSGGPMNTSKYIFQMNREEDDDEDDDDEEEDDHYLQKFDEDIKRNVISEYHPELQAHNYDEVDVLTRVIRNEYGVIVDPMHRTMPFVSKYERARIIGERAKQLNAGAKPFIEVDVSTLDGYVIALAEFKEKKIPFIVKRPLPNGGCEYWKLQDLEILE